MRFCGRVCEVAFPRRKRFHLEVFSISAYTHFPPHRYCLSRVKDAFAALGVTSSSSRRFLAVEPYDHFAYGMWDLSLLNDFARVGGVYITYSLLILISLPFEVQEVVLPLGVRVSRLAWT